MISIKFLHCPSCKAKYKLCVGGLKSGLGPSVIKCAACGHIFYSSLQEWPQMKISRKFGYILCSIFYILFAGYFIAAILTVIKTGEPVINITGNTFFRTWYLIFALLILSLQLFRVGLSYDRYDKQKEQPVKVSFLSIQNNLQFWVGLIVILGLISGFVIYVVRK
jgi:hypothetical protein